MLSTLALVSLLAVSPATPDPALRTVAESSGFTATATHAEVTALLTRLADRTERVQLLELGRTFEGRVIPLAVVADPPVRTPAEARAGGRLVVLAFGNIHAGEVCGKEALLMLARELALTPDHPLLDDIAFLLVPICNADGNERMAPDNRPGQVGPTAGMGVRPNAQGLDLNRDWVKLEAPETRAMVRLLTEWDPHLTIDTHTTNGSRHRYTLTYAAPLNPSGFVPSIEFLRDEFLPAVTVALRERTGYDSFFYGNFDAAHTTWSTYSSQPRFGGPYRGLRGQMSILSEAYAYAPYRDRVLATLEFVREIARAAVARKDRVRDLHAAAARATIAAGADPQPDDVVGIRHALAAAPEPVVLRGYALEPDGDGRARPTGPSADHRVVHRDRFVATRAVRRPYAYLVPPGFDDVVAVLVAHGITVRPFDGPATVEAYTITALDRADRAFQGHHEVRVEAHAERRRVDLPAGTTLVPTAQPLGTLAVYLLEPESDDGLVTWEIFGDRIAVGRTHPVVRVGHPGDLEASETSERRNVETGR